MVRQWEVRWEGELPARPQDGVGRDHAARRRLPVEDRVRAAGRRRRARADRGRRDGHRVGAAAPLRDAHAAGDRARRLQRARLRARAARRGDLPALHAPLRGPRGRTSTASSTRAGSTRPSTSTRWASTRATSRAASRSTSASTGPRRPPRAGSSRCGGRSGCPTTSSAGDPVRLTPAGLDADRRRRRLRDGRVPRRPQRRRAAAASTAATRWGWPVGVAHHLFAPGADAAASERAWGDWVAGVFASEGVA